MLEKKYYHRRILWRNCTSSTLFCLHFLFLFQISQSSQFPLWPETQNMFVFISKISFKSVSNWENSNNKVLLLVSHTIIYCKPTFIRVRENFERFTRASSSQVPVLLASEYYSLQTSAPMSLVYYFRIIDFLT